MFVKKNISLKSYNTFGIDARAQFLLEIENDEQLSEAYESSQFKALPKLVLGGGSNVLFTKNQRKAILKINIRGIKVLDQKNNEVRVKVGAGEVWHQFVLWCLDHDFGGVENLSLIPGTVGAAPIQNIGAYGVEL
ncbi:MAG: FAD-binding protein, partial [Cyclobacteriaceae bacterium]|nr:FAD-binding protein [Cyclobacteriaceae bacterium]